jgi:hypothetical protein
MVLCEFCNKELTNNSALKLHQTKTKYCLKLQGKSTESNLNCEYCKKVFTQSHRLKTHKDICNGKDLYFKNKTLEEELTNLKEELEKSKYENEQLRTKYENKFEQFKKDHKQELSEKDIIIKCEKEKLELLKEANNRQTTISNTTNNNYSNNNTNNIKAKYAQLNNLDLSNERIKYATDFYTLDDYNKGSEGMAEWCIKYILKDDSGKIHYICSDKNRRNFVYRDMNGNIINDNQANKLKEIIKPLLNLKLKECKKIRCEELCDESDDDNEKLESLNKIHNENKEYGSSFEKSLVEKIYI